MTTHATKGKHSNVMEMKEKVSSEYDLGTVYAVLKKTVRMASKEFGRRTMTFALAERHPNDPMKIMNEVQWSGEYSMEDFVVEFSRRTPVLMKTLTGTLGYDEIHIISGDEIYWIRGLKKQKRIVTSLKDFDKFLSIPLNYPVQFELYINHDTSSKKVHSVRPLKEIFDEIDLGSGNRYFIRALQNEKLFFQVGSDAGNKARFGLMEVIDSYDEKYLIGHPVCNNKIHSNVFAIPVYMNIELTVANSFTNHLQECFDKWFRLIEDIVTTFSEGDVKMCEEIIIFNKCPQNCTYEYIDPKTFTISEKSMAALKDYSKESNPYIIDKSSPSNDNNNLSPSSKYQAIRSVDLPSIPRRTPPVPGTKGSPILHPVQKTAPLPPPKDVQRGTDYEHPVAKPSDSKYTGILTKTKLTSADKDDLSILRNCRNSSHLKPDSGDVFKRSKADNQPSEDGSISAASSIYEINVKADFSKFSIRDVQRCLKMLNLEKHCETFEEMQVDGELLLSLDEALLISECSFRKLEAIKLLKFVKEGWRPIP